MAVGWDLGFPWPGDGHCGESADSFRFRSIQGAYPNCSPVDARLPPGPRQLRILSGIQWRAKRVRVTILRLRRVV